MTRTLPGIVAFLQIHFDQLMFELGVLKQNENDMLAKATGLVLCPTRSIRTGAGRPAPPFRVYGNFINFFAAADGEYNQPRIIVLASTNLVFFRTTANGSANSHVSCISVYYWFIVWFAGHNLILSCQLGYFWSTIISTVKAFVESLLARTT